MPAVRDIAKMLVENGAVYVAAHKQSLVDEPVQIYYHLPVGVSDEQRETLEKYLADEIGHRPQERQFGIIQIDDHKVPVAARHVLHDDVHLYRRTPVYVGDGVPGLDPVAIDDGADRVREIVTTKPEIEPQPSETVRLEKLVRDLADAGAASVEIAHDFLVDRESPTICLRIPIIPAEGKPIVSPVDSVRVEKEIYPLLTTLTLDGPHGSFGNYTALYVGENVMGLDPVTVEKGMKNGRELIEKAAKAEADWNLQQPHK